MAVNRAPVKALVLLMAAAAGVVVRGVAQWSSLGVLDGDEAVWGLMVRRFLDGELTAFYWGQGYGGTQEVLLTAPLFAVFGTSVIAMRAVPIALTAAAAVIVWRIGRRTIGEPAASFAAALFWVWPPYLIWKSDRAHGFYGSGVVLAALLLLLVLRLVQRRSRLDAALLGLVIGLAWWQTPQVVPVAIPALAFLAFRRPQAYRDAWMAVPPALLGALPWLLSNVQHDWWSFHVYVGDTPYGTRLRGFFSATLPMAIGLRLPFTSEWLFGRALSAAVYAGLVIALAVVLWRRRNEDVSLLFAVAVAYPFLYAISPATWLVDEPRYVVVLLPVLVLLLAQPLTTVRRGALALAAAAAISLFVLLRLTSSPEYERRADGLFIPSDFGSLIATLEKRGIDRVFSSYWVAYRLTFETRERVIAAEALLHTLYVDDCRVLPQLPSRPNDNRHRPYDTAVRTSPSAAWVLLPGTEDERRARPLLEQTGYVRSLVGGFAIFEQPARPCTERPRPGPSRRDRGARRDRVRSCRTPWRSRRRSATVRPGGSVSTWTTARSLRRCWATSTPARITRSCCRAWREVANQAGEGAVLVLAGRDGGGLAAAKALAYDLELERSVRFLEDVADDGGVLSATDVGVLSSASESSPNALLECLAAAHPVCRAARLGPARPPATAGSARSSAPRTPACPRSARNSAAPRIAAHADALPG